MIKVTTTTSPLLLETDGNIFTIGLDGTGKTYLTSDGSDYKNELASWSYDGSKIVYMRYPLNDPDAPSQAEQERAGFFDPAYVWTMNADGSDKRQLTSGTHYGGLPTFSPDGTSILFTGLDTGSAELWSVNADGTSLHEVTRTTGSETSIFGQEIQWSTNASYSPDGTKILYGSTQSGPCEIWIMNADGSDQRQLTFPDDPDAPDANIPSWSPDGTKIVFWSGFQRARGNIFTMNADGSDRTQLTFDGLSINNDNPTWSPDGKSIIFDSSRASGQSVTSWIMNADGTDQRLLFSWGHDASRLPVKDGVETIINEADDKKLQINSAVGANETVTFTDTTGVLTLTDPANFSGTIVLTPGSDKLPADNDVIRLTGLTVASASASDTALTVATDSGTFSLSLTNSQLTTGFANWSGSDVWVSSIPCLCRGTLILTDRGEVAVEALTVGDRVKTLSGECKPIVWVGFGRDLVTRANHLARPIVVRRGALADSVPRRDLYLTHGHALYCAGVLIPVEHLVNHRSIAWDETARVIEYYHVELADHAVLFAEGAPAETYHDAGNRAVFQNTREGSKAGARKPACAPVLTGGEIVERVWAELFERAGGRLELNTTDDADIHLVIDGRRLDPTLIDDGVYRFAVKQPPLRTLRLCSRSGVPSLLGLGRSDHRPLGAAIKRIILYHAGIPTCFDYDAPQLRQGGCYLPEDGYCWTDGNCELPTRFFTLLNGPFTLLIHTEPHYDMRYPIPARLAQAV